MTHVRTTIRNQFADLLDVPPYTVLGTRTSKRNREAGDALIDVTVLDVAVSQQTMGNDRLHTATLLIRAQREAPEDMLDDVLDADEVMITGLINAFDWSDLLEDDPELVRITFGRDGESEVTIGVISLRWTVEYRIDKLDPETIRG